MLRVASQQKTTIVNAAFLQEVKDSNLRLWSVLHELRDLQIGFSETRQLTRELVLLLSELRDAFALEISLEETYGFIEGAARVSSLGSPDARLSKVHHRELYLQLNELCEKVEEAQYRGTIGRDMQIYLDEFERFDVAFRAHEDFEMELIRCALGARTTRSSK